MNECITTVRVPIKLKEQAEDLIKQGYFKNLSDLLVTGLRDQIQTYSPNFTALVVRKIRKDWEEELMAKAKGNKKKAFDLFRKEIEEESKKDVYKNITY